MERHRETENSFCKENSELAFMFDHQEYCRCDFRFYYDPATKTCVSCHPSCGNFECTGPAAYIDFENPGDCLRNVVKVSGSFNLFGLASFDTRASDSEGVVGFIFWSGISIEP